jgi:hypothetical protein
VAASTTESAFPANSEELAPAAPAPERREQIVAFRELANQNARSALKLHDRRRLKDRARTMFVLTAAVLALAATWAALDRLGYSRWTAEGALGLCGLAVVPALVGAWHTWRLWRNAWSRRRYADKPAS